MSRNMKIAMSLFLGLPAGCYAVAWWVKASTIAVHYAIMFSMIMERM